MTASALRAALIGASGRMGKAIDRLAQANGVDIALRVGAALSVSAADLNGASVGVIIDFSSPNGVDRAAQLARDARVALMSGTTGVGEATHAIFDEASRVVPVIWEPNTSVGMHVLGRLLRAAVAELGEAYDIEIVETHHKAKVDAPSGSALRLASIAGGAVRDQARRKELDIVHGRQGAVGPRKSEIGVHAIRGGDVIGDHSVHLMGAGERIELTHRATDRDLFAIGALKLAKWVATMPPGRYTLDDYITQ